MFCGKPQPIEVQRRCPAFLSLPLHFGCECAEEEEVLRKGVSNQGYHYFGSAKIMCGIGKGFAEAMIQLQEKASEK